MSDFKEDQSNKNQEGVQNNKIELLIIFKCNCKCIMCSTGLQIDRSIGSEDYRAIKPYKEVIKDIERTKELGVDAIAFSGGEPTLRNDLFDLVKHAKKLGISHIEVQSNGRMYSYKKYCKKLVDSGVNNFVVSFHSHIEKIHDKIVGVPGTCKQLLEGVKNLNSLGQSLKINVVLTKFNYGHLEAHTRFLLGFNIQEIRFTMSMIEGNVLSAPKKIIAPMEKVGPHIANAIEIANKKEGVGSFVYNMVPCLIPNHVQYINDMGNLDTVLLGPDFEASLDEERRGKKVKSEKCKTCKYDKTCHGVWRKYAEIFGLEELKPIK